MTAKKSLLLITLLSLAGLLISGAVYDVAKIPVFFPLAITFGTMLYHLAARLAAGGKIDAAHGIFVIMQRYNRPRLRRLMKKQKSGPAR